MNPKDLKYSEEHEWVRIENNSVGVIGITQFACDSLGDVVFLELPDSGTEITKTDKLGEIESVKAVSEIYAPVSGKVIEKNKRVTENAQIVNDEPYSQGWLLKVQITDPSEIDDLMTSEQYEAFLASTGS